MWNFVFRELIENLTSGNTDMEKEKEKTMKKQVDAKKAGGEKSKRRKAKTALKKTCRMRRNKRRCFSKLRILHEDCENWMKQNETKKRGAEQGQSLPARMRADCAWLACPVRLNFRFFIVREWICLQ